MSLAGMLMMILSNVTVIGLTVYCFYSVLRTPNIEESEHAPLDIDTHDAES